MRDLIIGLRGKRSTDKNDAKEATTNLSCVVQMGSWEGSEDLKQKRIVAWEARGCRRNKTARREPHGDPLWKGQRATAGKIVAATAK